MKKLFDQLGATILEYCEGRPVYYKPNSGNWGDGLIRRGTIQFFDDLSLRYREITGLRKRDWIIPRLRGGIIIYGGGGGWCSLWNHSIDYLRSLPYQFTVIVLPSTYESYYKLPNSVFYRRDNCESQTHMKEAPFCHDMAFYLGTQSEASSVSPTSEKGYFFRTDDESSGRIDLPSMNNDISLKGDIYSDTDLFFQEIAKHTVVHTDRLHVAIAACLLGRELHFYRGSYFKNKAVYLSSMKDNFENVVFHEEFDFSD